MLQAWLSIGYIVLLAILVLAFILWRRGSPVLAIAALVVGIPLWFGWEYARPTWTTGVITGTEVRRSDPDARGNTTDIEYIYMRNRSDRGLELVNDDSLITDGFEGNARGKIVDRRVKGYVRRRRFGCSSLENRTQGHSASLPLRLNTTHVFELMAGRELS